jgi:hypothetical protein
MHFAILTIMFYEMPIEWNRTFKNAQHTKVLKTKIILTEPYTYINKSYLSILPLFQLVCHLKSNVKTVRTLIIHVANVYNSHTTFKTRAYRATNRIHTCFTNLVLDVQVFVRWTSPVHLANKGNAQIPGRWPLFCTRESASTGIDKAGGDRS